MRITANMQGIIERAFFEKNKQLTSEIGKVTNERANELSKEMEEDEAFIKMKESANRLVEKYGNRKNFGISEFGQRLLLRAGAETYIESGNSLFYLTEEERKEMHKKQDQLTLQKEVLLINLNHEKDLDKIKALLNEYGIEI